MLIPFASQAYERSRYGLPPQTLINLFHEQSPIPDRPSVLLPVGGLKAFATVGSGPIRAIYQVDGVLSDLIYIVSGTEIYSMTTAGVSTLLMTGVASGVVRMAASNIEIAIAVGGSGYIIDSAGAHIITDPDFPEVVDVAFINGYFIWVTKDSGQFIWSEILDGDDYDGLDFATAEDTPDNLVGVIVDHKEVLLFGTKTIEPWVNTGDSSAPFIPRTGSVIQRGCISAASITSLDNTVFFVGDDRLVYRLAGITPERLSTFSIEESLSKVSDASLVDVSGQVYAEDGHTFYVLDIPGSGTYAYDLATGAWHQRRSWGLTLWGAQMLARVGGVVFCGSRSTGAVYTLDKDTHEESFGPIERTGTAGVPVQGGRPVVNSLTLDIAAGVGASSGQGLDPEVMLRYSDDLGRTWSQERTRKFGKVGEYDKRATWRRLGRMKAPGRVYKFRVTDPVPVVIYGARQDVYIP